MMTHLSVAAAVLAAGLLPAASVRAAGGHFEVDDAGLIEPGHCQVEVWLTRAHRGGSGLHTGPACRVGPVELALNIDWQRGNGASTSAAGPQVKWAAVVWPGRLEAGLVWAAGFDLRHGGRPQHSAYLPATLTVNEGLTVNLNAGVDWDAAGARGRRVGASAEWAAGEAVTVIGERGRFAGSWSSRIGARLALANNSSIDLSIARVGPNTTRVVVIGFNHAFAR